MCQRDVGTDGDPTRVGVLDDRDGRLPEVVRGAPRSVTVGVVVERHLLAVQLLRLRETGGAIMVRVQGPRPGADSLRSAVRQCGPTCRRPSRGTPIQVRARRPTSSRTRRPRRSRRCGGTPFGQPCLCANANPHRLLRRRPRQSAGSTTRPPTDGSWRRRTIDGPPMSICSMLVRRCPEATVCVNGYRFTTTVRRARRRVRRAAHGGRLCGGQQGCRHARGCSVLTRPSGHSGNSVNSDTSTTGTPAAAIVFAVEPVDTSSTPEPCSAVANCARPVLS